MSDSEKRKHPRYDIDAASEIIFEQPAIEGSVKDISFGGFFIKIAGCSTDDLNKEVDVKIETTFDDTTYNIQGRCRITRVADGGMGLFFIEMNDESIEALNRVILNLSLQSSKKKKIDSSV